MNADSNKSTFFLVQLEPGADTAAVQNVLKSRLEGTAEVMTKAEFADRSLRQWLIATGAAKRSSAAPFSAFWLAP